jgi:hypothetical protein
MSMEKPENIYELHLALRRAVEADRRYEVLLKEWYFHTATVDSEVAERTRPVKQRGPVLTSAAMLEIVGEIIRMKELA